MLIHFLYPPYRHDLDIELLVVQPFLIVLRDKDPLETQFFGLCYPLFDTVDGADLTAQPYFTRAKRMVRGERPQSSG